jgi:hypothetical protein
MKVLYSYTRFFEAFEYQFDKNFISFYKTERGSTPP